MSKLFFLCLHFFMSCFELVSSSFSNSSKHLCPRHQALSLLHFKQSFSLDNSSFVFCNHYGITPYPKIESWKEERDCCTWDGVTCDGIRGHVIELDLSCSGLHGLIPSNASLFLFPSLQSLNLAFNDFFGSSISAGFGHFSSWMHLNLSYSGFSGKIASEIFQLSNLVLLDLSKNFVEISPHDDFISLLQNLTKLQKFHLRGISISSAFPTFMLNRSSLISLDLFGCGFHGRFPDHDLHLPNLELLDLGENSNLSENFPRFSENNSLRELFLESTNFGGELLTSIRNLKSLKTLYLGGSGFLGSIPPSLQNLTQLTYLHLGQLPPSIWNLTNLKLFDCYDNKLEGVIPSHVNSLRNLKWLDLSSNNFTGQLSASIWNLTKLEMLDCSYNKLEGINNLPNLNLTNLDELSCSDNNLEGVIPFRLNSLRNLLSLDLSYNKLRGQLPALPNSVSFFSASNNKLSGELSPSICKVGFLFVLDLSNNNLSGQLPPCLGNFSTIILQKNQFSGTIPHTLFTKNALRSLDLNNNQLEGPLPRYLITCRNLEVLNLGNNKINDTFPHWVATLPGLQVLILRSNSFHGLIGPSKIKSPFMSLRIIDLAYNDFEGDLPKMYLRSLKAMTNANQENMGEIYMGHQQGGSYYEDSVELTIKGLEIEFVKILKTFTTIDLSSNKFQGQIPMCFRSLSSLRGLSLSHNKLTGYVPSSLENLELLESLDLSSNKLFGRIPQQLTSLTFLEVLNLSQNHLIGLIPRGTQFDTFGNDSYNGNLGLCGPPLSKKCTENETPNPPKESDVKLENGFDWRVALMGYGCGLVFGLSLGYIVFLKKKASIVGLDD